MNDAVVILGLVLTVMSYGGFNNAVNAERPENYYGNKSAILDLLDRG
jgi:hypothetical protein